MTCRIAIFVVLAISCGAETPRYLATVKQRWDVSDVVCTAVVSSPMRTGVIRKIENRDRDQLSSRATIERCFKGSTPQHSEVEVIGYAAYAAKDVVRGGIIGSGPPTGFVTKGRNLLFLKRTANPGRFDIAVPVYETAIRLADNRPFYPDDNSEATTRFALTQEFEAALVQFDERDITYIDRVIEVLGTAEGSAELRSSSARAPVEVQRDIAVELLNHGQVDFEPLVLSLLQDASSKAWKRENAAHALGEHGTERAVPYLRRIVSQPATSDELEILHNWAFDALQRLERRLADTQ